MLEDCKYRELLEENRKLRESVILLREYDPVTNLYNREAFCASAERTIRQTPQTRFEIICIDIERRFRCLQDMPIMTTRQIPPWKTLIKGRTRRCMYRKRKSTGRQSGRYDKDFDCGG